MFSSSMSRMALRGKASDVVVSRYLYLVSCVSVTTRHGRDVSFPSLFSVEDDNVPYRTVQYDMI